MNANDLPQQAKQNLLAVLDYLLHLDQMRSKPLFRLSDHKLPFFHEHAFAGLPGIETNLVEGAEEIWLSIRRLQTNAPPAPHDWLRPWINVPNDPGKNPTLADSLTMDPEALPPIERLDHTGAGPAPFPRTVELHIDPQTTKWIERYLLRPNTYWSPIPG